MPPPNFRQVRFLKILLHAGFFASGISAVLIGQVLPILSQKLQLDDRQAGDFFIWQFAGSIVGTLLTNWFGRRGKFLTATFLGCFLMAVGSALLNFDSLLMCSIAFLINGLGIGLTLPAINMLILELNVERASSALSTLNFFWGVGAIISQPFVDFLTRGTDILIPTLILSVVLAAIALLIFVLPAEIEQKPISSRETTVDFDRKIWTRPMAWAIALFGFVHVGFESAMGGWLKTYALRLENVSATFPPFVLYFLFFVIGRSLAPFLLKYLDDNKMLMFGLLTILSGMTILLFGETTLWTSVGASLAGFGTSWIFPTNLSRFTKIFGASATRRATPLFISGTLGAAATTWLIGFVSNKFQNLRSGMFLLLFGILFLVCLQTILSFQKNDRK